MPERSIDADILIVGGGIQGVTLLHQLSSAGARRVFLASANDLGVGETLHSHGYMHCGYMMSAAGGDAEPLVQELKQAAAWWRSRLHPPYAAGVPVYYCLPADAAPERLDLWDRLGLDHEPVDTPSALRTGEADSNERRIFSIDDRLVSMRDILSELAAPLQDRIVRTRLTAIELDESGRSVTSCRLSSDSGEFSVRPRILLLACGRDAQPLLRAARTWTGHRPLEARCAGLNRIRFVPMLLVRGVRLPVICGVFETHSLGLFTHPVAGDESMWIVTFTQGHETQRGDFDPSRESAPGSTVVTETVSRLNSLVPEARTRRDIDLRFGFYFGGKTDHPNGGNGRYVDDCGIANLRLAWPGVWSLSHLNAREIASGLQASNAFSDIFDRSKAPLDLTEQGLATGVAVGEELRLTSALTWHTWSDFKEIQGIP